MLDLVQAIDSNKIYKNDDLRTFIRNLEERYIITEEIDFFESLVNFSANNKVPVHGWFKYREGYSHTLVRELLKRYSIDKDREYVIDPFCGSGTTLLEAGIHGYSSLGVDVNPMSVVVTNAKVQKYSKDDLDYIRRIILNIDKIHDDFNEVEVAEDLAAYFKEEHLLNLTKMLNYIKSIDNEKIRNLFFAGLLSIVEECSDRKRDGNGLKRSDTKVQDVISHYINKMNQIVNDLLINEIQQPGVGICGSATKLYDIANEYSSESNKKPGIIVFSPPYANSFDYFESYKMELRFGQFVEGLKRDRMSKYRNLAVRSFVSAFKDSIEVDPYIDLMAHEIELAIPEKEARTGKRDSRTRKVPQMIRGYFKDMEDVLQQCGKVLSKGQYCCIVVDQSSYLGKLVPTDLFLAYLGERHGFATKEIIICRKAKTSSQQLQQYPYLSETLRESIVILEKINE